MHRVFMVCCQHGVCRGVSGWGECQMASMACPTLPTGPPATKPSFHAPGAPTTVCPARRRRTLHTLNISHSV